MFHFMELFTILCQHDDSRGEVYMPKFSIEKIQEIRKSKNLTYDEIAKISGLSKSAVSKVFGGFQENPTTLFLEKMAEVFDCGIDDFFIFEKEPESPYYLDRKSSRIASEISENTDYRALFEIITKLNTKDVKLLFEIAKRLTESL